VIELSTLPFVQATLPLPPGVNASYKTVNFKTKDGRMVRRPGATPELEAFKQEAYAKLYQQKSAFDWILVHEIQHSKHKMPLAVSIDFYYPTRWRRDIDGGEKAVIDALFECIGLNDNLIVDKHTRKLVDRERPRCEMTVCLFEEKAG
jgi:Holliday junction resolvase RusA-like endonuclease